MKFLSSSVTYSCEMFIPIKTPFPHLQQKETKFFLHCIPSSAEMTVQGLCRDDWSCGMLEALLGWSSASSLFLKLDMSSLLGDSQGTLYCAGLWTSFWRNSILWLPIWLKLATLATVPLYVSNVNNLILKLLVAFPSRGVSIKKEE